ncbi:MAG TPA: hypothetical protein VKE72_08895 [Methylocella sp.]|nr:hypothetical protein [Methylocella sp.]
MAAKFVCSAESGVFSARPNPKRGVGMRKITLFAVRELAALGIYAAGNCVQVMNAAIERSFFVPDEARLAHWAVGRDERRDNVGGAIQIGESHLRIRNWILRTGQAGAAAADGGLRMARGAAIAVERRP